MLSRFFRPPRRTRSKIRKTDATPYSDDIERWVRRHGDNSNSFLTLYEGFRYFQSRDSSCSGAIAYVETPTVWTAATEPLAPPEERVGLLHEFRAAAESHGKSVMMLPVEESFAMAAEREGFDVIMIGSEPIFDLSQYTPNLQSFHSARHLQATGARVRMKRLNEITGSERTECERVLHSWLETRWMAPLSFLNRVHPWERGEHKRYFILEHDSRILGFLAAIPTWTTDGWYLIDLLRRLDAPAGTSEILILEAIRLLKMEGARWVSLGLAPLSRLPAVSWKKHPLLYRMLHLVYSSGNFLYRFKPLFEFKQKFSPTRYEPRYLVVHPRGFRLQDVLSLLHAFVPGGILEIARSGLLKNISRRRLQEFLDRVIDSRVAVRTLPRNPLELVRRIPFTLFAAVTMDTVYFRTNYDWKPRFSFSWFHLSQAPFSTLSISPFLHENIVHLSTNLLLTFTGLLLFELLCGSRLAGILFMFSALLSNTLTLVLLHPALAHSSWLQLEDVGSSLGIFGALGGLCFLFKRRRSLGSSLQFLVILIAWIECNWMGLNHIVAYWLGYGLCAAYFFRPNLRSRATLPGAKPRDPAMIATVLCFFLAISFGARPALPDEGVIFLPESRHQQYLSYAFLSEPQTSLLYRNGGRGWGEIGGSFALFEFPGMPGHPQIVADGSVSASYRLNPDTFGLLTETIDARAGVLVDLEPSEGNRVSFGYNHQSGHISDDVLDKDLIGPNLGWDEFLVRYIYARMENFHLGGTLRPIFGSDPGVKWFSADQFVEYYPIGLSGNRRKPSPYLAVGLYEFGVDHLRLTTQVQAGVLFGNHDRPVHESSLRVVIGYYNGVDPRLKYAGFKLATAEFGYAGFMLDF